MTIASGDHVSLNALLFPPVKSIEERAALNNLYIGALFIAPDGSVFASSCESARETAWCGLGVPLRDAPNHRTRQQKHFMNPFTGISVR